MNRLYEWWLTKDAFPRSCQLADHGCEINLQRLAVELIDHAVDARDRVRRAEDDDRVRAVISQRPGLECPFRQTGYPVLASTRE